MLITQDRSKKKNGNIISDTFKNDILLKKTLLVKKWKYRDYPNLMGPLI